MLALAALLLASPATALTQYGTYVGTNYTFTGPAPCSGEICESSTFGDPEPLFGAPTGSGDSLTFFPSTFSATSSGGAGGPSGDLTASQLQVVISGNTTSDIIDVITFAEFGDVTLSGIGTAATGAFVGLSGVITVLDTAGGAVTPVGISWVGTVTDGGLFQLTSHLGTTQWEASALLDVAALTGHADATEVMLSVDNFLQATSEAGSGTIVQKKVIPGPTVLTVPEPVAWMLLAGGGLFCLGGRAARRTKTV